MNHDQGMLLLGLRLILATRHSTAPPVTIQSLLHEMADRSVFARLPEVGYTQGQASSYDRAQTDPSNPKTWFANQDYGQFIRTEQHGGKTEWVVMEHNGPGAITRIWTPLLAEKDKMLVRFYLNGSDTPTIEEPFNNLMRGRSMFKPPFAFISWADPGVDAGVGSDLYYPIPFAKGCKVTMSEVPFYYAFNYRAYPPGTQVETFSRSNLDAAAPIAKEVGAELEHPKTFTKGSLKPVKLGTAKEFSLQLPKGPSAVEGIQIQYDGKPDLQDLRSTVVQLSFDGEQTAWCPIGEFFGCGVHERPVWYRYRMVDGNNRMSCFWTMPYARSAEIKFRNFGARPAAFHVKVQTRRWDWDSRSLHFHATWRGQYPLATRPMSDWNYVLATGNGVYVGDTLTVFSPSPAWYGEGDERVYVDGEKFPSHLGTGTEDYYGYAWGMAEHYSSASLSMPLRDLKGRDNWMGFTTTSRIRGLDAIPFDKSLRFDMEIWNWADCNVGYSATAFWYARPGATSNRTPMPSEAAAPLPEWSAKIHGAIECETMKVLSKSEGVPIETQSAGLTQGNWSDGQQLFVRATRLGDFVDLRLPVQKSGRYHVILYATKSFDYGVLRFSIDGRPSKDQDLWIEKPVSTGPIDLGLFDLRQGDSVLRAEVVGTNPRSIGSHYFFGLDCVVLRPTAEK